MSLERQILVWVVVFALFLLALRLLGSAVTPFATGIALSYLLDPVVRKMEKVGVNRLLSSLLILAVFVITLALTMIILMPILGHQLLGFFQKLPNYVVRLQQMATDEATYLANKYGGTWLVAYGFSSSWSSEQIQKTIADFVTQGAQWALNAMHSLASGGEALLNFVSLLIITPVVAFYLLIDWKKMTATLDSWLPLDHRESIHTVGREINEALAGFVRGQSLVCLFLGLWYGIGLTWAGLDFGLLIGVAGGVASFVPYVGSLATLIVALCVALVQGWPDWHLLLYTAIVVMIGQFLEGYVISPKLVGDSIGLHPVWLMFALFAFGALFGVTGLIVAVPAAAALGVLVRHLIGVYLASPLYLGQGRSEIPS